MKRPKATRLKATRPEATRPSTGTAREVGLLGPRGRRQGPRPGLTGARPGQDAYDDRDDAPGGVADAAGAPGPPPLAGVPPAGFQLLHELRVVGPVELEEADGEDTGPSEPHQPGTEGLSQERRGPVVGPAPARAAWKRPLTTWSEHLTSPGRPARAGPDRAGRASWPAARPPARRSCRPRRTPPAPRESLPARRRLRTLRTRSGPRIRSRA